MHVRRFAPLLAALALTVPIISGCASPVAPDASASTSIAPVTAEDLATGEDPDGVDLHVDGAAQVVFREITLRPGASTGDHCHAGQLLAVVEQGALTHYAPIYPDGVRVYQAGETIVEGAGYVHHGVNEGAEDVVLMVTYIIEDGQPLAQTDLTQCDR